jgi:hypothetical protein
VTAPDIYEAFDFDYDPGDEWPDYDPDRVRTQRTRPRPIGGGGRYQPTVPRPQPRPQSYTPGTPAPGVVTRAELTRALQRVAADIDRLKAGARATTGQVNDLADRTGRALGNVQTSQQQQAARFERGLAGTRELAVLGSLLGGGGGGGGTGLLLLLLLAGDNTTGPDGQQQAGGLGGNNSTLLLALALSGGLNL